MTDPSVNQETDDPKNEETQPAAETPEEEKKAEDTAEEKDVDSSKPSDDKAEDSPKPAEEKVFNWGDGLSLDVSATQMSARLELAIDYAEYYTAQDLLRYLKGNKITYGLSESRLQEIFDKKLFNESVVVSKGVQPEHGEDGYVDWEVELSILDGARLVERKGRVNWKDQHHVLQVEENDLLGRLISPTEGVPGVNVYEQELPANPGKEGKFPAGKGVRISEDGKEMYSDITGVVCRDGEKISVVTTYAVQGDVSLKTGNIDYNETVEISGNVLTDFTVKAGQDLHINGLVEGAVLDAGGTIFINGGVQGDQKAEIKAGGDINVKFINNATVTAGKNVIVSGSISNSIVCAGGRVIVDGNKSMIVGGETYAEQEIVTSTISTELGVKTQLILGRELQRKIDYKNEQAQQINALLANYKKLQQATNQLNELRDAGKLNPEQTALRLKIIRGGLQIQAQVKRMKEEQVLAKEEIETARKELVGVAAKEIAWPGTIVTILGQQYSVKTQTSKAIFALMKGEVNVFAYKEKTDKSEKKGKKGEDGKDGKEEGESGESAENKNAAVKEALTKIREDVPGA